MFTLRESRVGSGQEPPRALVKRLSDGLWLQALDSLPEAHFCFRGEDPVLSVIRFGLASRACQRIARHETLAARARALLDEKRREDRETRSERLAWGGDPRIVQLATDGDLGAVRAELQRGADPESCATWTETDEEGWEFAVWNNDTALSVACSQGHLAVVQLLLDRRANPRHRVHNEGQWRGPYTPLSIALQLGHVECARAVKRALHSEEEDKARKTREAALKIYRAATDEASLRQERQALLYVYLSLSLSIYIYMYTYIYIHIYIYVSLSLTLSLYI